MRRKRWKEKEEQRTNDAQRVKKSGTQSTPNTVHPECNPQSLEGGSTACSVLGFTSKERNTEGENSSHTGKRGIEQAKMGYLLGLKGAQGGKETAIAKRRFPTGERKDAIEGVRKLEPYPSPI